MNEQIAGINKRGRGKTILVIGIFGFLLLGSVLAVWLSYQQTNQRSKAAPSTTLSFSPSTQSVGIGQTVTADVMLDPGQNQVSVLKLVISYDSSKFDKASALVSPVLADTTDINAQGFTQVLQPPSYDTCNGTTCMISVSLSIGASPTFVITKPLKVATVSLKAKDTTDTPTNIGIDTSSAVYSLASTDQKDENVIQFSSLTPLAVTIGTTGVTPTPGTCNATQSTCHWDSVSGVVSYHYKITDGNTNAVIEEGDVDSNQTSVSFPSAAGGTYTCSVSSVNACAAKSTPGEATKTCPLTPTPTVSACPTPGTVKNLRLVCPNCPAQ